MESRIKPALVHRQSFPVASALVGVLDWLGKLITMAKKAVSSTKASSSIGKAAKLVKAGVVAGVCGIGLCALARKMRLGTHVATLAQSVEAVPFPGVQLYSFLAGRQLRPLYAEIAEEIVREQRFDRILDIATGPGYLPIEIALRKPDVCVCAIDQNPETIRTAETNARIARVSRSVEFSVGDPTNLPFPGRYFDLVVGVNVLHHWREPQAVLEEVFHVLIPGGEFWMYDYRRDVPEETWETLRSRLPVLDRLVFLFGPVASSRLAYDEASLLQMAEQTHFEHSGVEHVSLPLFGERMPVFNRLKLKKPDFQAE